MTTIRIRVLKGFILDRDTVAKVGEILELDPLVVYSIDPSKAEILDDPKRAQEKIDAAAKAHNATLPRAPRNSQLPGEPAPRWSVLPGDAGYRPHVH